MKSANINSTEKTYENKIALRILIAGLIVFLFAISFFAVTKLLSRGQNTGMPLVQVKEDGDWKLIRSEYNQNINPDITGYEFIYNEDNSTYDLVLHYNGTQQD